MFSHWRRYDIVLSTLKRRGVTCSSRATGSGAAREQSSEQGEEEGHEHRFQRGGRRCAITALVRARSMAVVLCVRARSTAVSAIVGARS
eukprot:2714581-Rhodomonas_salina.1